MPRCADQLSAIKANGTANIKAFVLRDQNVAPSAYAGFCAGAYMAAHDYVWETMYEGPGYVSFKMLFHVLHGVPCAVRNLIELAAAHSAV
eukprot:SAG11_NODE_279_length_11283_cov_11.461820_10_plen_90_part_00